MKKILWAVFATFCLTTSLARAQGAASTYGVADMVEVNYGGTWYRGMVIQASSGKYQVKRDDYTSDDRWVTAADLRPFKSVRTLPPPKGPLPSTVPAGAYVCSSVVAGFQSSVSSTAVMGTLRVTGAGSYTGLAQTGVGPASRFTYEQSSGAISWDGGNLKGFFGKIVDSQLGIDTKRAPYITVNYRVREGGNLFTLSCRTENSR
jgi:hypothetical protein